MLICHFLGAIFNGKKVGWTRKNSYFVFQGVKSVLNREIYIHGLSKGHIGKDPLLPQILDRYSVNVKVF